MSSERSRESPHFCKGGGDNVQLTVLGRYSPFPPAGGACPGYLLRHEGFHLLLECGSGTVARLQEFMPLEALDHVVLSHLHGDHCADVSVLKYAANYTVSPSARAARRGTRPDDESRGNPTIIYAPDEPEEEFRRLNHKDALLARPIGPGESLALGPFHLHFAATEHPLPCVATRIECGGRTLVYTGDTARCASVEDLARGADLLLAEASLPESCTDFRGHMRASEASDLARSAGVGRLLLTHFWPEADTEEYVLHAQAADENLPVAAAVEGKTYTV